MTYDYDSAFGTLSQVKVDDGGVRHQLDIGRTTPSQVGSTDWYVGDDQSYTSLYGIDYTISGPGRLRKKDFSKDLEDELGHACLEYEYDLLARVSDVGCETFTFETYEYDVMGVLEEVMRRPAGTTPTTWTYDQIAGARPHNLVSGRADGTAREEFTYDTVTGRMTTFERDNIYPSGVDHERNYIYDGAGKLIEANQGPAGLPNLIATYHYGLDDELIRHEMVGAPTGDYTKLWFDGWRWDDQEPAGARTFESLLPQLDVEERGGAKTRRWVFREYDGHAIATLDDGGTSLGMEALGAYGAELMSDGVETAEVNGYQGMERDKGPGLTHMGARHLMMSDGIWLQPEPLLHLGITASQMGSPRSMTGAYALGAPTIASDRSGYIVQKKVIKKFIGKFTGEAKVAAAEEALVYGLNQAAPGLGDTAGLVLAVSDLDAAGAMKRLATIRENTGKGVQVLKNWVTGQCFVEGTEVATLDGWVPIEEVSAGDLVLASRATEEDWSPLDSVRIAAQLPRSSPLDRACERVRSWAKRVSLPLMMLSACDVGIPPRPGDVVRAFDVRTATWVETVVEDVELDSEIIHRGHLFRTGARGLKDLGSATITALADANASISDGHQRTPPSQHSWVLVLDEYPARHVRPSALTPGQRFGFQGRVFEVLEGMEGVVVRETDVALGRATSTFVRTVADVIDAEVTLEDGRHDILTGTPNHPFWVPAVRDYVPLGELEVGTVLHVQGGGEAILVSKTWRQGDFEVYDIEVEGLHNFFVRGPGSDAPGVLVHNSGGTFRSADGRLRNADGTFAPDGGSARTPSSGTHGNTAGDQPATLYEKYDADGGFRKHGVSQDPSKRYTEAEMDGGYLIETETGPRREILRKERGLVETSPGPDNHEPWAGSRSGE